jgi:tetratricopeptide (TPR) repeat protein
LFLGNHHHNLGLLLKNTGKPAEAEAEYRKAQAIFQKLADASPDVNVFRANLAECHYNLGDLLSATGKPAEAVADYRKALELDQTHLRARNGLARAQRLADVQDELPNFLKGDFKPTTNSERLALAKLATDKKMYRASAGLYADAFAADPKLADDLQSGHRYNAACCAALAAAGQDEDAARLDDKERALLRQQALDWLRSDLTLHIKQLESAEPADRSEVCRKLKHWQQNSDLAGIHDTAAVSILPPDVQKTISQLWADVADLLNKAARKGE